MHFLCIVAVIALYPQLCASFCTDVPSYVQVYSYRFCSARICWYKFVKDDDTPPDGWSLFEKFHGYKHSFPTQYGEINDEKKAVCGGFTTKAYVCQLTIIEDDPEVNSELEYLSVDSSCDYFPEGLDSNKVVKSETKFTFYVSPIHTKYPQNSQTERFALFHCGEIDIPNVIHGGAVVAEKNWEAGICGRKGFYKNYGKQHFFAIYDDTCLRLDHVKIDNGHMDCSQNEEEDYCFIRCDGSNSLAGGIDHAITCSAQSEHKWSYQIPYEDREIPKCIKNIYASGMVNLTFNYTVVNGQCSKEDDWAALELSKKAIGFTHMLTVGEIIPIMNFYTSCYHNQLRGHAYHQIVVSVHYLHKSIWREDQVSVCEKHCHETRVLKAMLTARRQADILTKELSFETRVVPDQVERPEDDIIMQAAVTSSDVTASCHLSGGFILSDESLFCVPCSRGYYSNYENTKCLLCPKGTYTFFYGKTSCEKCPEGHTTEFEGADHIDRCIVIPK